MWSESEFKGKAARYFGRGQDAEEGEIQLIWCLLGLEFLMRAALARVSPLLLADPATGGGFSVLHAAGFTTAVDKEPVSVTSKTVVERLGPIAEFAKLDKEDAYFLLNLRNGELHSSASVALNVSASAWMPKFYRLVKRLADALGETVDDYLSPDFVVHARRLTDEQDKRLEHEVLKRIEQCSVQFKKLDQGELITRKAASRQPIFLEAGRRVRMARCPACDNDLRVYADVTRLGKESLRDEMIVRRIYFAATEADCAVCGLKLSNIREIAAVGLGQDWYEDSETSLEDRLSEDFDEPDYGND